MVPVRDSILYGAILYSTYENGQAVDNTVITISNGVSRFIPLHEVQIVYENMYGKTSFILMTSASADLLMMRYRTRTVYAV